MSAANVALLVLFAFAVGYGVGILREERFNVRHSRRRDDR